MKKKVFACMAMVAILFAGCQKEKNVAYLTATISKFQGAKDAKVYIDEDRFACWNTSGDQVVLNNSTQAVTYNAEDRHYYISVAEGDQEAEMFYSIFPASAVNGTSVGASTSVTLPAVQLYQEADGKQKVEALMAATGATRLDFKNICALLEVTVSDLPESAYLTKIEVTTTNGKVLCGTGDVTFTSSSDITLGPLSGGINGGKTIKLQFDNDEHRNGTYYLVVPPVSNTAFDISVHYRMPNSSDVIQLYTKRLKQQGNEDNSLAANTIGQVTFDMDDNIPPVEHLPGAYSVSDNLQVYFSRGNLKFERVNNAETWAFEQDQTAVTSYQHTGNGNNLVVNANGYFPWSAGTNSTEGGHRHTEVINHGGYSGEDFADWGEMNTFDIPAPNPGVWRTLTSNEWNYVMTRYNHNIGSPLGNATYASYAYVRVNGVYGVMLFPDLFEWPTTVESTLIPGTINAVSSTWNGQNYGLDVWSQLEDAGCVFLAAKGYWKVSDQLQYNANNPTSYYWSSTKEGGNNAYYLTFNASTAPITQAESSMHCGNGMLVRMVYDATPITNNTTK